MKKKINVGILYFLLLVSWPLLAYPAIIQQDKLEVSFEAGKPGNIFEKEDVVTIIGKYRNNTHESYEIQIYSRILDRNHTVLLEKAENVSVPPKTVYTKPITPHGRFSGMYTMEVEVAFDGESQKFFLPFYVSDGKLHDNGLGTCTHFAFHNPTVNISDVLAASAAGISMVRDECWWGDVETAKGVYTVPNRVQKFVDFAAEQGIEILMPLNYGNRLYCDVVPDGPHAGAIKMPYTDEQIAAYAQYCGYLAKMFRGKVNYFEVWNEPDGYDYNVDLDNTGSPETYAKLLKAAYRAVKEANPEALVVGVSAAGASQSRWFIDRVLAAGGGEYMDVLSVHPYIWSKEPVDEVNKSYESEITAIEQILAKYGVEKPIWATETGYSSGETSSSEEWLTDEQQGAYIVRTCMLNQADGRVEKLFIYELKDRESGNSKVENMGMLEFDGMPKPAFYMLAAYEDFLGDAIYRGWTGTNHVWNTDEKYGSDDDGVRYRGVSIHHFSNVQEEKEIYVMWTKGGLCYPLSLTASGTSITVREETNQICIDLGREMALKEIAVYDAYGRRVEQERLTLDFRPLYVVASVKKSNPKPFYSLTMDVDELVVEGYVAHLDDMPTVKAVKYGREEDDSVDYLDQATPDSDGRFIFRIPTDDFGMRCLYLFDGMGINTELFGKETKIQFYRNGKKADDLKFLQAGEEILVRIQILGMRKETYLIGGLYDETEKLLEDVDSCILKNTAEGVKAEIGLTVRENGQKLKVFIMDSMLHPFLKGTENFNVEQKMGLD